MKKLSKSLALWALSSALMFGATLAPVVWAESDSSSESVSEEAQSVADSESSNSEMITFVDDAGREVQIPKNVTKVAPSGSVSTFLLYTAARDKLVAVNKSFSDKQKEYIPEKYHNLPEIGQFYGKSANLNMETLIAQAPDVIIDLGEAKKTIKEDMDSIQAQVNIPTIFIEARMDSMADTYRKLGKVLGEEEHCEKLAKYVEEVLAKAKEVKDSLEDSEKKTVYWAMGDAGLKTNARGSFQVEALELVGAENVVDLEAQSRGGATEVSMENILTWAPEYVLIDSKQLEETMSNDEAWQAYFNEKKAVPVVVPFGPYGFISNPPSANRYIGVLWLGNLLYPEKYQIDLKNEVKNFYDLFYGIELNDEDISSIIPNFVVGDEQAAGSAENLEKEESTVDVSEADKVLGK